MSDGPIKRAREAFARREPVSTNAKTSTHLFGGVRDQAYCGHRKGRMTTDKSAVTCSACIAAAVADAEATGVTP